MLRCGEVFGVESVEMLAIRVFVTSGQSLLGCLYLVV